MFAEINKKAAFSLPFALLTLSVGREQESIHRPEGHEQHQILWVTEGSCTYRVGNELLFLSKGEGVYMRPHVPHAYEGRNLSTAWCTFSTGAELPNFLGLKDYLRFQAPPSLDRETDQLLRFCLGDSTVLSRSAAGYSYIIDFFSKVLGEAESFSSRVLHLLEQRYAEPLTLSDLAEELQTDKYTLCRRYKSEQGATVMEDLTKIRIEKAKQLLKYQSGTVGAIGRACGFDSPSYFGKRFREAEGCTPEEYRRMNA